MRNGEGSRLSMPAAASASDRLAALLRMNLLFIPLPFPYLSCVPSSFSVSGVENRFQGMFFSLFFEAVSRLIFFVSMPIVVRTFFLRPPAFQKRGELWGNMVPLKIAGPVSRRNYELYAVGRRLSSAIGVAGSVHRVPVKSLFPLFPLGVRGLPALFLSFFRASAVIRSDVIFCFYRFCLRIASIDRGFDIFPICARVYVHPRF